MPKGNYRIIIDDLEEVEALSIAEQIVTMSGDEIPYTIQDCVKVQVYSESRTGHRWKNVA